MVDEITEFNALKEELKDPELDAALKYVVKLIAVPDVAQVKVGPLIVKLQALSAKFGVMGRYYETFSTGKTGTPENKRKNLYKTMNDELDNLVAALKYLHR